MADDLETNGEGGEVLDPRIREQLRRTGDLERQTNEANARADAAERKAAFAEVGIPTEGAGKLFRDTYQGDPDPDAVKMAAESYGILGQRSGDAGNDGLTEAERLAHQRIAGAGSGIPPAGSDHMASYAGEMAKATSAEEVMQIVRRAEAEHPEIGRFTVDQ